MNVPVARILACAFVSLAAASMATSFAYREQSLEQKVANATLVVIGQVSATSPGGSENGPHA